MSGTRSAADVLLDYLDQWALHVRECRADDCPDCEALFNLVLTAHKVYTSSRHRAPRPVEHHVHDDGNGGSIYQYDGDVCLICNPSGEDEPRLEKLRDALAALAHRYEGPDKPACWCARSPILTGAHDARCTAATDALGAGYNSR